MNNLYPLDRFSGVRAFLAVADCGSFNAAAVLLGLSPSAVSKAVSRLEERLRVRLFQRTTRRLLLTEEGRNFRQRSARALAELAEAEIELSRGRDVPAGLLRVDLPILFGRRWIAPILFELSHLYPDLQLDISFSLEAADLFASGIDLVVRIGPLHDSSGLSARALGVQDRVLCATPAYLDRAGRPLTVADLQAHECLAETRRGREVPWPYTDEQGVEQTYPLHSRFRIGGAEALADAARSGRGLAMLPRWFVADDLRSGALEAVLPERFNVALPINILWARTSHMSPKIRVVIDALKDRYGDDLPWDR